MGIRSRVPREAYLSLPVAILASRISRLAAFKRIRVALVLHNPGDIYFFLFSLIIDAREFPNYKEDSLVSSERFKPHFSLI